MMHQYLTNLLADQGNKQPDNVVIVEDRTRCCPPSNSLSSTSCHNEDTHMNTKIDKRQEPKQGEQPKGRTREHRWRGGFKRYTSDSCLSVPKRRTSTEDKTLSEMIRWTSLSGTMFPDDIVSRKKMLITAVDVALDVSNQLQEEQEVRRAARHVVAADSPLSVPKRFLSPKPTQKGKVCQMSSQTDLLEKMSTMRFQSNPAQLRRHSTNTGMSTRSGKPQLYNTRR